MNPTWFRPGLFAVCHAVASTPRTLFALFVCGWVVGASTLPCAGWITFCTWMLVSSLPLSHLDPAFSSRELLSVSSAGYGSLLMASSACGSAVLVDAGQVFRDSMSRKCLVAGGSRLTGEFSQPLPQGSSLVASFRSLQTRPKIGIADCLGALVPCPGPSGGTAWRL